MDGRKRNFPEIIMKFRWLIALAVFILAVAFRINGSSIGEWRRYAPDNSVTEDAVILGETRPIRFDEWCVFTPMALSQYYNDFRRVSPILRAADTDVSMVYAQSVRDWSAVFRPFQIGFLFLSPDRGLSFYWCGKLIALFMVSFEFGLMITDRRRLSALAYAAAVTFAPVIQWWFSVNAFPDMMVYGQGLLLSLAGYLDTSSYRKKIVFAAGMTWLSGAYLLVLYPAWQVSFFYVFLGIGIWVILDRRKKAVFSLKKDGPCLLAALLILVLCMVLIFHRSWDTVRAVRNTVYPGMRTSTGGGGADTLFRYAANPAFPFSDRNVPQNVCEMASFYDLFPVGLIASVYVIIKRRDRLTAWLLIGTAVPALFMIAGFPAFLARITLLSAVPTGRCAPAVSYANLLLLFRSVSVLFSRADGLTVSPKKKTGTAVLLAFAAAAAFLGSAFLNYRDYFSPLKGAFCAAVLLVVFLSLAFGEKTFCAALCAACLLMGATVNPVRLGIGDIRANTLGREIESLASEEDGKWLVVTKPIFMGNFPIMYGAPTINCTNLYPNRELWDRLDPDGAFEEAWNRYALITTVLTDGGETNVEIIDPTLIRLTVSADKLPEIGAHFVLSDQKLSEEEFRGVSFEPVWENETTPYRIYRVSAD